MRFECSRTALIDAVSTVLKVVSNRTTMPILDGILIEVEDKLKLTGYDMETGIEYKVDADVFSTGSIVIKGRLLNEIVRKLPEEMVLVELGEKNILSIESGSAFFQLKGLNASDYPQVPVIPVTEHGNNFKVAQKTLKEMINQTSFAASTDESRAVLNGINIFTEQDELNVVAIDGFRFAVRKETIKGSNFDDMNFIVPARSLNEVARILEDKEDPVTIAHSINHILFDTGNITLVSRLIKGEFLDYRGIIPTSYETSVTVSTQSLRDAFERVALVIQAEDRRFSVTIETKEEGKLDISAKTDIGSANEKIDIVMEGKYLDIDFNPKYFIEALKAIQEEEVNITFNGGLGPCVISPVEGDSFSYLLLPLRR